ncbi:N-glycosidase F, putative [Minicystis rosea]|nr:N-glycosidase F, putative [Minicystis rosea]
MRVQHSLSALALFTSLALATACGGSSPASTGGAGGTGTVTDAGPNDDPVPGQDAMVAPFDKTAIYFTGTDNKRIVDLPASFPKDGAYSKIILHLALACPSGGCDPWDRFGSLGVVTEKSADGMSDTVIEVARFITPYHVGASWDLDVTDLRPLLTGDVTMRAFIDTWVGPGSQYGDGWLLSASFEMTGGIPEKVPVAVVPVWTQRNVVYGDPSKPLAESAPAQSVTLPKGSSYALRTFVTGHGQGNANNCAEFCSRTHTITAGSTPYPQKVWRTDCATTAAPNQEGTYKYSRAGWCPGADVRPWAIDVTADVAGSATATFAYDVEAYENTCRPDAAPCSSCTLGATCDYDGGAHTEPNFAISSLLIAYR